MSINVINASGSTQSVNTINDLIAVVQGVTAGADASSVNPSLLGGYAVVHGANPTDVSTGAAVPWRFNKAGVPFMIGGHPNAVRIALRYTTTDGAQTDTALVSVSSGTKIVVTHANVIMSASNTANVSALMGFATATMTAPSASASTGVIIDGKFGAGCGASLGGSAGMLAVGGDGYDVRFTCDNPVGGDVRVALTYYTVGL